MKKDILISYFLKNLNKKILKKINFSLVLILMCISLNAQEIDYYQKINYYSNPILKQKSSPELEILDSAYNNAPYIFKGTVLTEVNPFAKPLTDGLTCLIQIDEVYRGHQTLKEGTVNLIIKFNKNLDYPSFYTGESFIWACKKSEFQQPYFSPSNLTNLAVFYYHKEMRGPMQISCISERKATEDVTKPFDYHFYGFNIRFKTKNELDDFLNNRYGLKPSKPLVNNKKEKKKKKKTLTRKQIKNKIKVERERLKSIAKANMPKLKSTDTEGIEFNFHDIDMTEDENISYLEFNITVKSINNNKPFIGCTFKIRYESDSNEYPFKQYIAESDSTDFQIIRISPFNENTYNILETEHDDGDANVFRVSLFKENSSGALKVISSIAEPCMRIKMKINEDIITAKNILEESTNIEIFDAEAYYVGSGYTTLAYDEIIYATPNPRPMLLAPAPPPAIISYHIEDVNGVNLGTTGIVGVGHVLVITGTNFDIKTADSRVYLELADATSTLDNTYPTHQSSAPNAKPFFQCKYFDILEWTDTTIKVGLHYDYIIPDSRFFPNKKVYARTGLFGISKNANMATALLSSSIPTPTPPPIMTIKYAIAGKKVAVPGTTTIINTPYLIAKHNCVNGFKFRIDEDIKNDAKLLKTIKAGLKHWSDYLGITLKLEMNTLNQPVINDVNTKTLDGINTIAMSSTLSTGVMGSAKFFSLNINNHFCLEETDIIMSSTITPTLIWETDYQSIAGFGEVDFYGAFIHELGHIIGLGHSTNTGDLMNPILQIAHDYPKLSNPSDYLNDKAGGTKAINLSENVSSNYWTNSTFNLQVLNSSSSSCPYDGRPSTPQFNNVYCSMVPFIFINFETVNNATDYIIECSTEGPNIGFTPIQTLQHPTASYVYEEASVDTDYYFRMKALNEFGDSDYSYVYSIRTPNHEGIFYSKPPTYLNTDKKQVELPSGGYDDCIEITWVDNSDDETGFIIQRSTSATTNFTTIATVDANETIYTDCDIELNTEYFYKIFALNDAGMSASSDVVNEVFAGDDCISDLYLCGNFQNYIAGNPSITERAYSCTDETQAKIPANGGYHIIADDFIELNPGFEVSEGGEFIAEVIDGICETNIQFINREISEISDIEDLDNSPIQVYPNPNNGIFTIHFNGNNTQGIFLYDMMSKVVLSIENPKNQENIDISNYANGMYVVKVIKDKGVETFQIIKE